MIGIVRFFGWSFALSVVLWKLGTVFGFDVGNFPGTITLQGDSYGIRIPLLFCLITSVVLTLVLNFAFGRRK
jgi:hypothetical protein